MKPETVGLSAHRLARLDEVMKQRYVDTGRLPGLLTMVYRRGALAHTGMSGSMDIERDKPMREDAIFRIYSMTKPITAVALMMLAEEGLIGLDDDVATHIPSWKNLGVYATGDAEPGGDGGAGVSDDAGGAADEGRGPGDAHLGPDLWVHEPDQRRPGLPPSAHCRVRCRGRAGRDDREAGRVAAGVLAGDAVELFRVDRCDGVSGAEAERDAVRGVPAHPAVRAAGDGGYRVLVPDGEIGRFTSCYMQAGPGIKLQDDAGKSSYAAPPALESGGGGLVSTAHDYMRFCRMMLGGGTLDGVQILSPKTVALFSLNHLAGNQELGQMATPGMFSEAGYSGIGFSIGCGVNINVARTRLPGTLGEYFWGGAASTAFWIDPKEDLAVVFMTQVMGSDSRLTLRRDLRTLVYSAMTELFA